MKKDFFIHLIFFVLLFLLLTLIDRGFNWGYLVFWIGGVIGTILPDLDHLIYVYFLSPTDLTSQRVSRSLGNKEIVKSLSLLYITRYERTKLIFHTIFFQLIFLVLTFFVISSSGSFLGRGIVIGFSLHLLVDQLMDLRQTGSLETWFRNVSFLVNFQMDRRKYWVYLSLIALATLALAFLF